MNTVIVGIQWGDEGKGKITDFLAKDSDIIVRFSGGNNAGHTIVLGEKKFKLHLIPSGIFYENKICVLGSGMVINLEVLKKEINDLKNEGINTKNLYISENAHLILPYHILIDQKQEELRAGDKLGTTCQGIGPAYVDKVSRRGIRLIDMFDEETFSEKLKYHFKEKETYLKESNLILKEIKETQMEIAQSLKEQVADTTLILSKALKENKKIIFEGAQGILLDLDFGTYPYVTSCNTLAGSAATGAGVPPYVLRKILGVFKAYTTRVGTGPFPTEIKGIIGDYIREKGGEFGTTTGRPRRCGFLDLVILKYALRINGINSLALTKLDVLSGMSNLKIAYAYRYKGKEIDEFPQNLKIWNEAEPIYKELPGWEKDLNKINSFEELPEEAKNYLKFIEGNLNLKIEIISIGAERNKTITR